MQAKLEATKEDIREIRQDAYLGAYPIEEQLEALTEAAAGRPEKLNNLLESIKMIKELYPYSEVIIQENNNSKEEGEF